MALLAVLVAACGDDGPRELPHLVPDAGPCEGVVCKPVDSCHAAGTCDPVTGKCTSPQLADDTPCDDGTACTFGDSCQQGACVAGGNVECRPVDECHEAGTCDPKTGCSNPVKADGAACGDGNACTKNDRCKAGACVGEAVTCTSLGPCFEQAACSPATGECVALPKADGASCDPGGLGKCEEGTCGSGKCDVKPKACVPPDSCHLAGACVPETGECEYPTRDDGALCDDGDACTTGEICRHGACDGGAPLKCGAVDSCHEAGQCDPSRGCLVGAPKNSGSCNDGNACTEEDTCRDGKCRGREITCTASDACVQVVGCDARTGKCLEAPVPNGVSCDDRNACTLGTTCQNGACAGGRMVTCQPKDDCHAEGTCDPVTGACSNPIKADGTTCNDGNLCTQKDRCVAGACTGADEVACEAPAECKEPGTCNPATGTCSYKWKPDGVGCDDSDLCSSGDRCISGRCLPTSYITCSDPCLENGGCNPTTGACVGTAKPNGVGCEDGDPCTLSACQGGTCTTVTTMPCTPLDACHAAGQCDSASGRCTNPPAYSGATCTDGTCFTDITKEAGLQWIGTGGTSTEVGAGGAFLDYDGDGRLDIALAGEGASLRLYRNRDGTHFDDVTSTAGLSGLLDERGVMGVVVADFDNDGYTDMFALAAGTSMLLRNMADGTFDDVTQEAGLSSSAWATAAAFGDYDGDGWLDLYVGNHIASFTDGVFTGSPNILYRNKGDRTFADVTAPAGVGGSGITSSVQWSDVDRDGHADLLVCNDRGQAVQRNGLYLGSATGTFVDASASLGFAVGDRCLGLAAGDFDGDEDIDYYVAGIGNNLLLRKDSSGFTDVASAAAATVAVDTCTSKTLASWDAKFGDFDLDGVLDLYVSNGEARSEFAGDLAPNSPNELLKGDGSAFKSIGLSAGIADPRKGRGAAVGDIDNDGDLDILQVNLDGMPVLLKNNVSGGSKWLIAKLKGQKSNRDGVGARLLLDTGSRKIMREATRQEGHGTASDARVHFGLGSAATGNLTIKWPSGNEQHLYSVAAGAVKDIVEPLVVISKVTFDKTSPKPGDMVKVDVELKNSSSKAQVVKVDLRLDLGSDGGNPTPVSQSAPANAKVVVSFQVTIPSGASGSGQVLAGVTDFGNGRDEAVKSLTVTSSSGAGISGPSGGSGSSGRSLLFHAREALFHVVSWTSDAKLLRFFLAYLF
ncbi:MAG: CRTAC1 family protein [Deltaproteobacteria bacterium]|nr:CRTAC1 family protein [Deltaproteobacteria bacterium]